jgi:hypothetical protein
MLPNRPTLIAAHLRGGTLDRALIAGASPTADTRLEVRAAILVSERRRAALAEGLERMLQSGDGATSRWRVRPPRASVRPNASALRELIALLRRSGPLYAQGVAMLGELLSEGTGPAYTGDSHALANSLTEARAALLGVEPSPRRRESQSLRRVGRSYRLPGGAWIHGRRESS